MRANLLSLIMIVPFCLSLTACQTHESPAAAEQKHERAEDPIRLTSDETTRLGLSVQPALFKTLPKPLETAGIVKADTTKTMPVLPLVPGRIEQVFVQPGDTVKKGQKLATVRSDEVAQLEADLLESVLALEADERQLLVKQALAKKTLDRKELLLAEKIAAKAEIEGAQADYEEATAALESSQRKKGAQVSAAQQRLKLFGIAPQVVREVVKTRTVDHIFDILAPRAGIITERGVDPGEAAGTDKPLFTISDLGSVWVIAHVFEKDISRIGLRMDAAVTVDAFPGEVFKGHVNFISSDVTGDTRTVDVRATIANPQLRLKPGMFAKLNLQVGTVAGLFIPEQALQKLGESNIVYVQTGANTFQEQQVSVGERLGRETQIVSGLKAGDRVVAEGSVRLLGKVIQRLSQ